MQNFISILAICSLVLLLFIGVFQESLAGSIEDKGEEVEKTIDGTE